VTGGTPSLAPSWAIPGGVVQLTGAHLPLLPAGPPRVFVGDVEARVLGASSRHVRFTVPAGTAGGTVAVRLEPGAVEAGVLVVARSLATGLHLVDSPAFDGLGRLYATHSGSRGVKVPVPLYRIRPDGTRDALSVDLPNPTSIALGPDGAMYISSRFEGQVYRLTSDDRVEVHAADLGVPTGLAFSRDGTLFVGDRSGTVFRVSRDRQVDEFASLPASVAAFHLAFGPDQRLYVSAPTLSAHDVIYRITPDRLVDTLCGGFGRPQGLAFDDAGMLYVADALAGASGIYRVDVSSDTPAPQLVAAAPVIVGLVFDPGGGLIVASSDAIWRLDVPLAGARTHPDPA
jgi:sugar lactone lactonase YvrE